MKLCLKNLSSKFTERDYNINNTGQVYELSKFKYQIDSSESTIRYIVELNENLDMNNCSFWFYCKIKLEVYDDLKITHFSVTNGDISDGTIWEINKNSDSIECGLNGVIKLPIIKSNKIYIYINTSGKGKVLFEIKEFYYSLIEKPLNIMFFIDPFLERSQPEWKADYFWWFEKIEIEMSKGKHSFNFHYMFNEILLRFYKEYKKVNTSYSLISLKKYLKLGNHKELISKIRKTIFKGNFFYIFNYIMKRILLKKMYFFFKTDFVPDIIIGFSDLQILEFNFKNSMYLNLDGMHCREPFPDEMRSLDVNGLYSNNSLLELLKVRNDVRIPECFFDKFFPIDESIKTILKENELDDFLLVVLQDSTHYNFYDESNFSDQLELLLAIVERFSDKKIIFTQHPDKKELSDESISLLLKNYSNLYYIKDFEKHKNVSQKLLPFCSGIISVSSGMIYQAIIYSKPVYFMGKHSLKELFNEENGLPLKPINRSILLTNYFFQYKYLFDGNWLFARIIYLYFVKKNQLLLSNCYVDFPSNVFQNLEAFSRK